MFVIHMGAVILGRKYDGLTALGFAALVSLWQNPLILFDTGFLLSYGAVIGIYVLGPIFPIPIGIQMISFPIMASAYYETCRYSIVWNLIAVPLASVALSCGMLGAICRWKMMLNIAGMVLRLYESGGKLILKLPGANWVVGQPKWIQILLYYALIMAGVYFWKNRKEMLRAGILFLGGISILCLPQQCQNELEITMVNVGQGDCFLVETLNGKNILIDGGSSDVSSVGQYRIEPFLKSQGIGRLDYVFVTHGDQDHISGIYEMLERQTTGVKIGALILPVQTVKEEVLKELEVKAKQAGAEVYQMEQGKKMFLDDVEVYCVWPMDAGTLTGNEASLVLSVTYGRFDALFTGDLEGAGEKAVCDYIKHLQKKGILAKKYELLKVGHHGSRNGTSEELLELLQADVAFISAGERNSYGHPHQEVLNRLANRSINLYNTKDGNAVKLCTDGEKYYILEP